MDMKIQNLDRLSDEELGECKNQKRKGDGILHFKYMPRTGDWGHPIVAYATFTPAHGSNRVITELWRGEGTVQFHQATWQDLPTMFSIVNVFHNLEILEYREAQLIKSVGGKDLRDVCILR
jgi:hypothetical protein